MTQTVYDALAPLWQKLQDAISEVSARLRTLERPCRVCFVGRFSTGKSRLINALVGKDILQFNTDECTSRLVELAYGEHDAASRLIGTDIDTAVEQPIELSDFNSIIGSAEIRLEDEVFRRYTPNPVLTTMSLVDIPGFDGTNSSLRERGKRLREVAIRQSDICILVVDKGLNEDDLPYAEMIQQYAAEMIVVVNKTDQCENIQEVFDNISEGLTSKIGIDPSIYACSALWQLGSEQERKNIQEWRLDNADDDDEATWHQWGALVNRLSHPMNGQRLISLLAAIRRAFALASDVNKTYDPTLQAEATFLDHLPQLREIMSSIVGTTVLDIAISAAESKRPLPWARLLNFGIMPEDIAPKSLISLSEFSKILELFIACSKELTELAKNTHNVDLFRAVLCNDNEFIDSVSSVLDGLNLRYHVQYQEVIEEASWYSQPFQYAFSYNAALADLQLRWKTTPSAAIKDITRIRHRLAAALA